MGTHGVSQCCEKDSKKSIGGLSSEKAGTTRQAVQAGLEPHKKSETIKLPNKQPPNIKKARGGAGKGQKEKGKPCPV